MKYVAIWIGYGIAVASTAFGTHDASATTVVAVLGGVCAVMGTMFASS